MTYHLHISQLLRLKNRSFQIISANYLITLDCVITFFVKQLYQVYSLTGATREFYIFMLL